MMVHDKFNKETQVQNCSKAVNCNGLLVIVIFNGDQKKPSVEAYTGNNVTLVRFGRIGYVSKKDKNNKKLIERGFPAITV